MFLVLALSLAGYAPEVKALPYPGPTSLIRWKPYDDATLAWAKAQHKPLFVLISASWCHWCHEYETRSLETTEVATVLNEEFVPVFVEHDMRPDVVARYPSRGLPETLILNSMGELEVTVPGFIAKDDLLANLKKSIALLQEGDARALPREAGSPPTTIEPEALLLAAKRVISREYDPLYGGFGLSVKLPRPEVLSFLLAGSASERQQAWRTMDAIAGDTPWLQALNKTGLFDPLDGGFFRYATNRNWSAFHDEKLLGLNAELVMAALEIARQGGNCHARSWAVETLSYLTRTLGDPSTGEFFGSQAADPSYYRIPPDQRHKRTAPGIDRRHYAAPSAQMALALFKASEILGSKAYEAQAIRLLTGLKRRMRPDGSIAHDWNDRTDSTLSGVLGDQAWSAMAMLAGYETTRQVQFRESAEKLLSFVLKDLRSQSGGFAMNSGGPILLRANGEAALAFAHAYRKLGIPLYRESARHALLTEMRNDLEGAYGWSAARMLLEKSHD